MNNLAELPIDDEPVVPIDGNLILYLNVRFDIIINIFVK